MNRDFQNTIYIRIRFKNIGENYLKKINNCTKNKEINLYKVRCKNI